MNCTLWTCLQHHSRKNDAARKLAPIKLVSADRYTMDKACARQLLEDDFDALIADAGNADEADWYESEDSHEDLFEMTVHDAGDDGNEDLLFIPLFD